MAISAVYLWSYVYNIIRISSKRSTLDQGTIQSVERSSISNQIMTPPGKMKNRIMQVFKKLNMETIFSPSIVAAIVGFAIGSHPSRFEKGGAIPAVTLIVGGNLLNGLRGSNEFGLVHSDPLYVFVLLLQYALPPAVNIATITQLFGAGEKVCSVIMLWTYVLASVALTFWSALFMWLVA
ncbi:hypothetical protein M0R45_025643 [Rubus argutus]|uniref:Uncharacterized protein n=1 Tax=Rubus argutus TaxID=59490 RepID=A0AAW1WXM7_RUBAR